MRPRLVSLATAALPRHSARSLHMIRIPLCVPILLALVHCVASAATQGTTGRLSGTVADSTGARIPDAAVLVENVELALRRNGSSSRDGQFAVEFLPPGHYT